MQYNYLSLLEAIRQHFRGNGLTNTVRNGNVLEIDEDKAVEFPAAFVDVISYMVEENRLKMTVLVQCLDQTRHFETTDQYWRNDNVPEVMNEQFIVMTQFLNSLSSKGPLHKLGYQTLEDELPTVEAVNFAHDNLIVGWSAEITIQMKNDVSHCGIEVS